MKSQGAEKNAANNSAQKSEDADAPVIEVKEEEIDFSNVKVEPLFEEYVDFDIQ